MDRKEFFSKLSKLTRLFASDPDLAFRRVGALFLQLPDQKIIKGKVNGINFEFDPSLGKEMARMMYFGAYEVFTIGVLRRLLKPGDTFVDVGANIGYLSACAASFVGHSGEVHAFEPVPEIYQRLNRFAQLNPKSKIFTNQLALGEREGEAEIGLSSSGNIGQNTMVNGYEQQGIAEEKVAVKVKRLDEYLLTRDIRRVSVIKIDTEGFELLVLKGLDRFLEQSRDGKFPALIVEVSPDAYPLLGRSLNELQDFLTQYGYSIQGLKAPGRAIKLSDINEITDVLCVPQKKWELDS
ncbi:MAG TPA: FkbM family methyltransferase [Pyrinomonadaceae bacterium]|nr:FkbM family methyltransferase [Pyrinomonadaceae bacterium]